MGYMIYEHFRVAGTLEFFLWIFDLVSVTLRGVDVRGFDTTWDEVLLSMGDTHKDDILESMYRH